MANDNETQEIALAVMTKAFCEWCEWAFKVAGFETDDSAELKDAIEEKIRTAKREGWLAACEAFRDYGYSHLDEEGLVNLVESKAPGAE